MESLKEGAKETITWRSGIKECPERCKARGKDCKVVKRAIRNTSDFEDLTSFQMGSRIINMIDPIVEDPLEFLRERHMR